MLADKEQRKQEEEQRKVQELERIRKENVRANKEASMLQVNQYRSSANPVPSQYSSSKKI